MSVDKIPVTQIWSLLDDKRKIDANNDQFISIPEALKTNPEELSSILRDATDDSVDPKKLANFMKNIFKRNPNLAKETMQDFARFANYAPQKRLPLLDNLKSTELYYKPSPIAKDKGLGTSHTRGNTYYPDSMGGGDIRGGTVESHPQTVSSNGATLPENKEEVIKLYHDVPDQYKKYVQLGIFENNDISKSNDKNVGRYAPQDRNTEQKTEQALNQLTINKQKHVVVVNSGGPHSIAAARALAKKGYLILVHFNHLKGDAFIQDTGALLYFAKEIADLNRATVKNNPQAPWALILDAHQNTSASDESVHSKPILEDRDLPPIPNGYGIIEITEGHHSLHDQSATKEKLVWDSLRIAKERGVKGIYNLGLDPYKSSMP